LSSLAPIFLQVFAPWHALPYVQHLTFEFTHFFYLMDYKGWFVAELTLLEEVNLLLNTPSPLTSKVV